MSELFGDEFVPNEEASTNHKKWEQANPRGDAPKWREFRDKVLAYKKGDSVPIPSMATPHGKALIAAGKQHMSVTDIGSAPPPAPPSGPIANRFVNFNTGVNDLAHGLSPTTPWKTLGYACANTSSGHVIGMAPGTYTENVVCNVQPGVSIVGAGGLDGSTVIRGSADILVQVLNATSGQSIGGFKLDGQNRTAGTRGIRVATANTVEFYDIHSEGFRGGAEGGCGNFTGLTNCIIRNSVFRNGAADNATYASGSLQIGVATGCTFYDLTCFDSNYMAFKCGTYQTTAWTNCEFYNCSFTCGSQMLTYGSNNFPSISFEANQVDCVNTTIRNCYFNATLSLPRNPSTALASGYRYDVHHNFFDMPTHPSYACEFDNSTMTFHHNYVKGGANPLAGYSASMKSGNSVHHNVFDPGTTVDGIVIYSYYGQSNFQFYNNTVLWRGGAKAVFYLNRITTASTVNVYDNIFSSISSIGDRLGGDVDGTPPLNGTITSNVFYNITARGTSAVVAGAQPLTSTTASFPTSYVPTAAYTAYGAFADGAFTVGIE